MFFKDVKIYIRIYYSYVYYYIIHNFCIFAKIIEINPHTNDFLIYLSTQL